MTTTTKLPAISWAKGLAAAAAFTIAAGTQAHATVIDGITLPLGATFVTQTIFEQTVNTAGQTLQGVGRISEIDDASLNPVWQPGVTANNSLTFTFSGFTASFVVGPTATTSGFIEFTGGTFNVYVHPFPAPNISSAGSQATDFANAQSATLLLSAAAQTFAASAPGGPATTTLEAIIPAGATLNSFSNAFGSAFFDVTGGDAASALHSCSFAVGTPGGTCPPNKADLTFTESFNAPITGDWSVSGTGSVKALTVPEPASLALLGGALLGFGGFASRRRRRG